MNKKFINLFAGGLIAIGGLYRVNPSILPIATPTATPSINLIHSNLIKNLGKIEFMFTNKRGEMDNVKVTAKDATSITIDNGGTSVKVDVASNTHFRRKFWGGSDINEISIGDSVDIIGRWTSEDKTEIKAVLIRDLSIQKRQGVFFGTVKSMTDTGFVMTTIQRGTETVDITGAKLIDRKGQAITSSDIQVGDIIRVRGLWDSTNFTITEVAEVKDFSLPLNVTPIP
ncbi:MAG: hypothetical protein ABSC49_00060 [Candidatus Microgenomates bacterium]|jgi:hypothetical protein